MKKLNKVASLFATAALAFSAAGVSAQSVDNWVSGTGLPWKNGTNELCWRNGVWTPATGLSDPTQPMPVFSAGDEGDRTVLHRFVHFGPRHLEGHDVVGHGIGRKVPSSPFA